jgi:crotonobetaine/carnitine-CoA ligase
MTTLHRATTQPGDNDWHWMEQDTLLHAFRRVLDVAPQRVFLDFSGQLCTYAEFDRLSTRFAHELRSLGVRPGDTVMTVLDNNLDAVMSWFAINKIGAISVPINTALRGEFLRHQLDDAGGPIVVCESGYLARVAEVAGRLPSLRLVLCRGDVRDPLPELAIAVEPLDAHRGTDDTPIEITARPGDTSCIIYTSGTTGPSKGSMQSYNYFCHLASQRLAANPASSDDITFTPLPLFHNNALATGITATVLSGGRIAIAPRFSLSNFWPEVHRSGATIVSLVGSIATLIAEAPDNEWSKRCFGQVHTVRGVPFTDAVKEAWRRRFGAVNVGSNDYGMTEAALITWLPQGEFAPPGSSGKRCIAFDVRIVDDDDRDVPVDTPGEIIVRPNRPNVMFQGYWRRPEATVAAMRNQWFHTGDIGRFDEQGYFYFVDRKKDYLKRRGENISSYEMEVTIKAHPAILEVAVHAVPSRFGDDDVKVTAVLKGDATVTPAELCQWIAARVPYFAVPRYIEFRDHLPKNPQDKVLKYQLRQEGVTGSTWDLESSGLRLEKR